MLRGFTANTIEKRLTVPSFWLLVFRVQVNNIENYAIGTQLPLCSVTEEIMNSCVLYFFSKKFEISFCELS